jgi:CHAT domain-containing protein
MISLLNWLWETAVEPVWAVLRDKFKLLTDPRIWWMRTGPIALAPIHAAGAFSSEAEQSGFHKVISSYVPTLKALRYSREKMSRLQDRAPKRFMAVSMPTTPGMKDLPSVEGEIKAITETLKRKQWECEELPRPCADEALERMFDGYDVLHIACHGVSNFHQPAESALCFVKPAQRAVEEQSMEDKLEELDRLTVSRLSHAWLKDQALIVYLSACSTAGTMGERLANQVVHIASEFQLIGFPHVIGTLWKSQDEPCSRVATKFYEELLVQDCFDAVTVAKALNHAVTELRKADPSNVFAWLPFVHFGP